MKKILTIIILSSIFSGCNYPEPIKDLLRLWISPTPVVKKEVNEEVHKIEPPSDSAITMSNAEILKEMIQDIFQNQLVEFQKSTFNSLMSSMNQGASIEGLYHGLIVGEEYRDLESKSSKASPEVIKYFVSEMSELQLGMKSPTIFSKESVKNLQTIDYPVGLADPKNPDESGVLMGGAEIKDFGKDGPDSLVFGDEEKPEQKVKTSPTPIIKPLSKEVQELTKNPKQEIADLMLKNFANANQYTIKRVLCEEVMNKMEELKRLPSELAKWYADFMVRTAKSNVDFGHPQRNSADYSFYYNLANIKSFDRLKWEAVNRYQRILNHFN